MSRRNFRVAVREPRPTSAWVMVGIASATLWITQQLDLWALAAQVVAILVSLWRRENPFPWQSNPWILNAGMLAITLGTTAVALRGEPSTIALAHFAATTQGLQLIDARPRRTEFLLVTLALFQVVLAANLTDSVFFTPFLIGFVFATVWTLLVHTLRSEALEAGQVRELPQAFTPGLLRTTLVASGLAVVLAMLLFVTLPRLRSSVVRGPVGGSLLAAAGFSERVELGTLGKIRGDPRVVMRVETLKGEAPPAHEAYWRGLAFDSFDGRAWSITPPDREAVPGSAEGGVTFGNEPGRYDLVQRIVREPVEGGVIFLIGTPKGVQGTLRRLERDISGGLYGAGQSDERVRYTVQSFRAAPDDETLRADTALPPRRRGEVLLARADFSPSVAELAARIVAGADTDADRARAIERHLVQNGHYTDTPTIPDEGGAGPSPVERFVLGDLAGHCEYFASAMVVLAREVGLPARLVNGFAGGRDNEIGGFVEVTPSDAHAGVEIHFAQAGWVRYDPTPPDLRARAELPPSLAARLSDLASAIELWWFQRVVGFDRSDQIGAMKRAWLAWRERNRGEKKSASSSRTLAWRDALERRELVIGFGACAGIGVGIAWLWRRRRGRDVIAHRGYLRALRLLARRGLVRPEATAARRFAQQVRVELPAAAGDAFGRLTEAYLAERFGARAADSEDAFVSFERALRARAE
jgi:transglutaminase-like putative cysteine protease